MNMHSSLHNGERQVAPTVHGIRPDHRYRYEWAAKTLPPGSRVMDIACGVGYGAFILAEAGHIVTAVDSNAEALAYAREHYAHTNIDYVCQSAESYTGACKVFDAIVCFETIEHLANPAPVLAYWRSLAPRILASVPNEAVFPHRGLVAFHYRHYTRQAFESLLGEAGFAVTGWSGQRDEVSPVEEGVDGRTLVVTAEAGIAKPAPIVPEHVVILGLGPTLETYVDMVKRLGGRNAFCDEVWGINAVAGVVQCDRVFHMDDMLIQEARAARRPESNIAKMLEWMRGHPGPIYTSVVRDGYPGLVEFPLQAVINAFGWAYFNSTASYAVAYANFIGVKKLSLFGCDFSFGNSHLAERGRACMEFHLGIAAARGVEIGMPSGTSLMDACASVDERIYGYDCVHLDMTEDQTGAVTVAMRPRDAVVTADEIERRYDHSRPTVPAELLAKSGG